MLNFSPTLKNKFFLQLVVILIIMVALGTIILEGLRETRDIFDDTKNQKQELVEIQEILTRHLSAHDTLNTYLISGDETQARLYRETMSLFVEPYEEEYFTKISQIHYHMSTLYRQGIVLIEEKKRNLESTTLSTTTQYNSLVGEVDVLIDRVLDEKFLAFNQNINLLQEILSSIILIVTYTIIAAGFVILVSSAFIVFPVIRRLQNLTNHVTDYTDNNSWSPVHTTSRDEVGLLTRAYNEMSQKIYNKTRDLKELNTTLNQKVVARTKSLAKQKAIITEQAERLDTIIESIGEGIIVLDEDNKIVRINNSAAVIFGVDKTSLYNKNFITECSVRYGKDKNLDLDILLKETNAASLPEGTVVHINDQEEVALAGEVTRIFIDKVIEGSVIVLRDETERRNLDKLRSEFASVVSHQMRTPMSIIRWVSEEIIANKHKEYTKKQIGKVTPIHENNTKMIELVNNFIQLSKLDGGNLEINRKETNLVSFTKEIIKDLEAFRKRHGAKITLDIPKTLIMNLDQGRIREVFYNLINNAVKYSSSKGLVEVSLLKRTKKAGMITLAFKDNGMGIPKEDQKNIFEKFYRATNARKKIEDGNGLGLYIVKAVVELHRGNMAFTSNKKGTTFYIMLPKSLVVKK